MLTKQLQFAVGTQSPGARSLRARHRLLSCSRALHPQGDLGNAGRRLDMGRGSPMFLASARAPCRGLCRGGKGTWRVAARSGTVSPAQGYLCAKQGCPYMLKG